MAEQKMVGGVRRPTATGVNPAAKRAAKRASVSVSAKKSASKRPGAKNTETKKAAPKKALVKKAAVKKAPVKKAPVKKAAPKQTPVKKAPVKKAAVKKAPVKKAAPKQAAPKQAVPKQAVPKQAVPKKAVPKQAAPKQAAPKKALVKKAAPAKRPARLVVRADEKPWTSTELAEVRQTLEAESRRLRSEIATAETELNELLRDSGDGSGDDQADAGSKTFEREHEMSVANNSRDLLEQVEHALVRIGDGSYGLCERCAQPIGKARLQVFPRATLCLTCKQREERR
jgi:RNA polymerase-binding protein DksA